VLATVVELVMADSDPTSDLAPDQLDKVETLKAVTGATDDSAVINVLRVANWNMDIAANLYFDPTAQIPGRVPGAFDAASSPPPPSSRLSSSRDSVAGGAAGASGIPRPTHIVPVAAAPQRAGDDGAGVLSLITTPLAFLWNTGWNILGYVTSWLPGPLGTMFAAGSPSEEETNFVAFFEGKYGERHPRFFLGNFQGAVREARTRPRCLLAYIHSAAHGDSDRFCSNTLCNDGVVSFVDDNFVFWAGPYAVR
jgi:FAS-associated factor 2